MKVSVLIPFFGRIEDLLNCLAGLSKQTVLPGEVIVISDRDLVLPEFGFRVKIARGEPPICRALNAGLKVVGLPLQMDSGLPNKRQAGIICFTDPDAVPYPDWIEKMIEVYKKDSQIGGVGGRDEIYRYNKLTDANRVRTVGKMTWFGRMIGRHHEISEKIREVDFLKGCNMSFRRELISSTSGGFDEYIPGFYLWELDMCFKVKAKGYKLIYDPEIKTKHFKEKEIMTLEQVFVTSHNTIYLFLKHFSHIRKFISVLYAFLIGQRGNLGFLKSLLLFLRSPCLRNFDFTYWCILGKIRGIRTFLNSKCKISN